VGGLDRLSRGLRDAGELLEVAAEEGDLKTADEIEADAGRLASEVEGLEFQRMFPGKMDSHNAFLDIQAGAGGTESCDWADMLLRMYNRWAERRGFKVEIQDIQAGDQAGITKATLLIKGEFAYGYAKAERGVHRLVRISPFDSNKRRHTSFCAVDVVAEINEDIEIEIPENEIRVDVYRSSGKGGQGVNTTDSAVQIQHKPSGLTVRIADERSQIKNRAKAMTVLRSRLLERKIAEENAKYAAHRKDQIGTGDRSEKIRTYNFPQNRVTDHRIELTLYNLANVIEGEIDPLIQPLMAHDLDEKLKALKL